MNTTKQIETAPAEHAKYLEEVWKGLAEVRFTNTIPWVRRAEALAIHVTPWNQPSRGTFDALITESASKISARVERRIPIALRSADGQARAALTDRRGMVWFRALPSGEYTAALADSNTELSLLLQELLALLDKGDSATVGGVTWALNGDKLAPDRRDADISVTRLVDAAGPSRPELEGPGWRYQPEVKERALKFRGVRPDQRLRILEKRASDQERTLAEDPGAMHSLVERLRGDDWHARCAAVETLGRLGSAVAGHPGVLQSLLSCLRDEDSTLRRSAAEALGRLGTSVAEHSGVVDCLRGCMRDEDHGVRASAANTLARLGKAVGGEVEFETSLAAASVALHAETGLTGEGPIFNVYCVRPADPRLDHVEIVPSGKGVSIDVFHVIDELSKAKVRVRLAHVQSEASFEWSESDQAWRATANFPQVSFEEAKAAAVLGFELVEPLQKQSSP